MDKQKVIDKIYKCLRLAESCNPNEAAAGLRQAQGLMKKYGISEEQVSTTEVAESRVSAGDRYHLHFWVVALADVVSCAFSCRVFVARGFGRPTELRFIGIGSTPELSSYTYTVLLRNLQKARQNFIDYLEVDEEKERARQGDVFAQAWLFRVARQVSRFVNDAEASSAIDTYIDSHYGQVREFQDTVRDPSLHDIDAINSGLRAGERVSLFRPMGFSDEIFALSGAPG